MLGHDKSSELAAVNLVFRRSRSRHLPSEIFSEIAWEVLLEAFIADSEGRQITGREIVSRSATTPAILSQWLRYLSSVELIVGDGSGNLDRRLMLSGAGMQAVESIMEEASVLHQGTIGLAEKQG